MITLILIIVVGVLIYKKYFKDQASGTPIFSMRPAPQQTQESEYTGETGGIRWQGISRIWKGGNKTRTTFRYFRWSTVDAKVGGTRYLMIMSLPNAVKLSAPGAQSGWIGGIINKLAETALDMYVGAFFGDQYKPMINVSDGTIINAGEKDDFFILTNDEPMGRSFLESAEGMIRKWKQQASGFSNEKAVDAFGILFAPEEMMVSAQTTLNSREEVDRLSDFAAALAVAMQKVQAPA